MKPIMRSDDAPTICQHKHKRRHQTKGKPAVGHLQRVQGVSENPGSKQL